MSDLLAQAFEVFRSFRDVGLLAGLMLLVNLLVNLSHIKFVSDWLAGQTWVRALAALVLGGGSGLLAAIAGGVGLEAGILAVAQGIVAGLGAIGLHEGTKIVRRAT